MTHRRWLIIYDLLLMITQLITHNARQAPPPRLAFPRVAHLQAPLYDRRPSDSPWRSIQRPSCRPSALGSWNLFQYDIRNSVRQSVRSRDCPSLRHDEFVKIQYDEFSTDSVLTRRPLFLYLISMLFSMFRHSVRSRDCPSLRHNAEQRTQNTAWPSTPIARRFRHSLLFTQSVP